MFKYLYSIIIFLTFCTYLQSQDSDTYKLLEKHIQYLSSDSLEGRLTGTQGEQLAKEYIIREFEDIGIKPLGVDGRWTQAFEFKNGSEASLENNNLTLSGKNWSKSYDLKKDYYILNDAISSSLNHSIIDVGYGIEAPSLSHNDYAKIKEKHLKGKVFLMRHGHPDDKNPHSEFNQYADYNTKIEHAKTKGAQGIIFLVEDSNKIIEIKENYYTKNVTTDFGPVILLGNSEHRIISNTKKLGIKSSVNVEPIYNTGHNVVGFLDNNKSETVIIGAHYDHLGHGELGGSLYTGPKAIHNGADDNASGVAMVIDLARQLKASDLTENNYLFICFSGEELGLYGSNFFTKNPTMPMEQGNYMLNFDMIGRLDTTSNKLVINGTGTSPAWDVLSEIKSNDLDLKLNPSGIGPSDHMQFYLNDIPALHFFTGAHEDYHRPSDDEDKINYEGLLAINSLVINLIDELNDEGTLAFTKTKETKQEEAPRFTVGLGVIPDYLFDGKGMRIDGVREGKVADKAELKKGDIVIQMGEVEVFDMMSYMKALSQFSKGDSTTVKVKREESIIEKNITFF